MHACPRGTNQKDTRLSILPERATMTMAMTVAYALSTPHVQFSDMGFITHNVGQTTGWHFPHNMSHGGISISPLHRLRSTGGGNHVIRCSLKQESNKAEAKPNSRPPVQHQRKNIKWAPRNSDRAKRALSREVALKNRRKAAKRETGNTPLPIKKPQKRTAMTVVEALIHYIHKKNWQDALKVFGMLREQSWYEPKLNTYKKLLVLLGRCRQPEHACSLFQMMKEEGCEINAEIYTALISAHSKSGDLDKAFAILEEMKRIPQCQPDVFTYSILIKYCFEASLFEHVNRLLEEMSGREIVPSIVTKNILIDGYGKAGMFQEMEDVLAPMLISENCKPDQWTMNAIMRTFGNIGKIEIMEKWYQKFQNIGIQPDIRTFEILISSYAKENLYEKMAATMEYMQKLSLSWTTATYNVVIDAFGRTGEIGQMEFAFNQMRLEGANPDSATFCSLISAYGKAGKFNQIKTIVQYVENSDIIPDTPFYNTTIDACRRARDVTEMEKVFKQMQSRGCIPDQVILNTMKEAYISEGMPEKFKELEEEMENMHLIAD